MIATYEVNAEEKVNYWTQRVEIKVTVARPPSDTSDLQHEAGLRALVRAFHEVRTALAHGGNP